MGKIRGSGERTVRKLKPLDEYDSEYKKPIDDIKFESALAGFGIAFVCLAGIYLLAVMNQSLSGIIRWIVDWVIILSGIYLVRLILKFYNNIDE